MQQQAAEYCQSLGGIHVSRPLPRLHGPQRAGALQVFRSGVAPCMCPCECWVALWHSKAVHTCVYKLGYASCCALHFLSYELRAYTNSASKAFRQPLALRGCSCPKLHIHRSCTASHFSPRQAGAMGQPPHLKHPTRTHTLHTPYTPHTPHTWSRAACCRRKGPCMYCPVTWRAKSSCGTSSKSHRFSRIWYSSWASAWRAACPDSQLPHTLIV